MARPVAMANFHITLAFVGEIGEQALERLCLAVDGWPLPQRPEAGRLRLDSVGFWPRPGIYWLGPGSCPAALQELASKLRGTASRAGARRERKPFQPHVTLYRNCQTPPPHPPRLPTIDVAFGDFTLFESRQGRNGVSYHPMASWQLR
jgi:2'-5' RNA ligase